MILRPNHDAVQRGLATMGSRQPWRRLAFRWCRRGCTHVGPQPVEPAGAHMARSAEPDLQSRDLGIAILCGVPLPAFAPATAARGCTRPRHAWPLGPSPRPFRQFLITPLGSPPQQPLLEGQNQPTPARTYTPNLTCAAGLGKKVNSSPTDWSGGRISGRLGV
jgi:hypothetical protein